MCSTTLYIIINQNRKEHLANKKRFGRSFSGSALGRTLLVQNKDYVASTEPVSQRAQCEVFLPVLKDIPGGLWEGNLREISYPEV